MMCDKSFPGGTSGKESACQCRWHKRHGFDPWVGKIPWRREKLPTPVFWPGEFHGLHSPWGHKELDTIEQLSLTLLNLFRTTASSSLSSVNTLPFAFQFLEVCVSPPYYISNLLLYNKLPKTYCPKTNKIQMWTGGWCQDCRSVPGLRSVS